MRDMIDDELLKKIEYIPLAIDAIVVFCFYFVFILFAETSIVY
jgi:hypothetical protein